MEALWSSTSSIINGVADGYSADGGGFVINAHPSYFAQTVAGEATEPSLRVERDGDKMTVYASTQLSEAQFNAVNATLLAAPDRT